MMSSQPDNERHSAFALDPAVDRAEIEARIAQSIEEQVHLPHGHAVVDAVHEKYEELLAGAKVKQHVPTLTEGVVRAEFRHRVVVQDGGDD